MNINLVYLCDWYSEYILFEDIMIIVGGEQYRLLVNQENMSLKPNE